MGVEDLEINGELYRWSLDSLYIKNDHYWIQFPTVKKRQLLLEAIHWDNVHIRSVKMAEKLKL